MAHELDENKVTGKKAMFSVLETPWYREGIILNQAPSFEEALKLAGVDFEVEARPVYALGEDGKPYVSPTGKIIVRKDRGVDLSTAVMSVVGDSYTPVQHREAFGILTPLLDKGVATLETGGCLSGGRDAWMMVKFNIIDPVVIEVFKDEVVPFGLITNNHNGYYKAKVKNTAVRVVCRNTLNMAMSDGSSEIAVSHRGDAKLRLVEAAEQMWGGIIERYQIMAKQYKNMKETSITVEEFTKSVLDVAAPHPKKAFTPDGQHLTTRGYDAAYEAAQNRRDAIFDKWYNGSGHVGDQSIWEAYNGAVEVLDHDAHLFRTRGTRVASLISGSLSLRKKAVLDSVFQLCKN